MPLDSNRLMQRVDAAMASGDPDGPLANITDEMLSSGTDEDRSVARQAQLEVAIDPARAAATLRRYLGGRSGPQAPLPMAPRAPSLVIPPTPVNLLSAFNATDGGTSGRAGDSSSRPGVGGRRHRRKTHRRPAKKSHRKTRRMRR